MIKLIRKGKVKCICDVCKTKFSYEPQDILSEDTFYIECPKCKKKNKIKKEIIEIILKNKL